MSILNNLINGISLVYGIAKMLNFAHGDIIMVGAYICFFTMSRMSSSLLVGAVAGTLLAMAVCTVLGVVIERLAYKPLRQAPSLAVLITAIGVSYFLQNSALLLWSSNPKSFTSVVGTGSIKLMGGQITVTYAALLTVVVCVVVMLGLTWFTGNTKMGKAMRACSEDKSAAQLMGIDVNTTISMTFAIGSALAAVAGVLFCSSYPNLMPTTGSLPGRRRVRRHRLHPRGPAGRHPAGHHRDLCQGVQHQHLRRRGVPGADRGAAGQAHRPFGQGGPRESLRWQR